MFLYIIVMGVILPAAIFGFLYAIFPDYFAGLYVLTIFAALYLGYVVGGVVAYLTESIVFESALSGLFEATNVAGTQLKDFLNPKKK